MDFPNIKDADKIAIDLETKDPNIIDKGHGWATNDGDNWCGHSCGWLERLLSYQT